MNKAIQTINSQEDISQIENFNLLSPLIQEALNFFVKEPLEKLYFAVSNTYITPYSIIAVSTSPKHIDAMTIQYIKALKDKLLFKSQIRVDGNGEREWCTIDLSDCFLHIITVEKLQKYELEKILQGDYTENDK